MAMTRSAYMALLMAIIHCTHISLPDKHRFRANWRVPNLLTIHVISNPRDSLMEFWAHSAVPWNTCMQSITLLIPVLTTVSTAKGGCCWLMYCTCCCWDSTTSTELKSGTGGWSRQIQRSHLYFKSANLIGANYSRMYHQQMCLDSFWILSLD